MPDASPCAMHSCNRTSGTSTCSEITYSTEAPKRSPGQTTSNHHQRQRRRRCADAPIASSVSVSVLSSDVPLRVVVSALVVLPRVSPLCVRLLHPELVLDLSGNHIDGPGVDALQAAARALADTRDRENNETDTTHQGERRHHRHQAAGPTSPDPAPSLAATSCSCSCSSVAGCRSCATLVPGFSVWSCPRVRLAAYSRRLSQHRAAQLQAAGCARQAKHAIQVDCQQQAKAPTHQPTTTEGERRDAQENRE